MEKDLLKFNMTQVNLIIVLTANKKKNHKLGTVYFQENVISNGMNHRFRITTNLTKKIENLSN
jgi:hypothetical protein